ncbi:hypothetical protein MMYC01_210066 [Madurella mycetomatis]|uniref:Uncharacterized protein n=1 Tax=Madurella mycetomatis TaxID=100816 RepID=A0A175VPV7_9PEZI|nr:hypothetical protein MMYC01_210066 [Madurella mycetomatis]
MRDCRELIITGLGRWRLRWIPHRTEHTPKPKSSHSHSSATATTPPAAREEKDSSASGYDDVDGISYSSSSDSDYDGHRPTRSEMRTPNRTCSTATTIHAASLDDNTSPFASGSLGRTLSRRSTTILSRIRPDLLVDFDSPSDPYKPLNWPLKKKVVTTFLYGLVTMSATWASSCYAPDTAQIAAEFGVSHQVSVLGRSLEVYGRRLAVFVPMFVAICFGFGSATSKDFQTLVLTRFFGPVFASAPVTNTGDVLGDLFGPAQRGIAMADYAMAVVAGPALEYLSGILQSVMLIVAATIVDESYPLKLLVYKARRLRIESGNWALHANFEEWDVSVAELALRGWSQPTILVHFVGAVLGCGANVYNQLLYNRVYWTAGNRAVPERRLPAMMVGSVLFARRQFTTGWTSKPEIHWIVPAIGLVMLGTGFFTIFQAALNYLVDTFTVYAASAVAANTFLRSCFACAFPLVVGPIYHNLGVGPGSSIPASFAALLIPVPFVFFKYGKKTRGRSRWPRASIHGGVKEKRGA